MSELNLENDDYRKNVGMMIINEQQKILAGEAFYYPGEWLMPQGGMAEGEAPVQAMQRELIEETGLTTADVSIISEYEKWIYYLFPKPQIKDDRMYIGQRQKWFLLSYEGLLPDATKVLEREFRHFDWVSPNWLMQRTPAFNVPVYQELVRAFSIKPD